MSQKKVSVLIITWNKLEFTKKCLKFLEANTNYPNLEVIIVDNDSNDGTRVFLEEIKSSNNQKYKVILNSTNLGYAIGVNQGIKKSVGKYILLLNNDVYVLKNWLIQMIKVVEKEEKIAIVGAKLVYPKTTRIQHAGIIFIRKLEPLHIYKNCLIVDPNVNKERYVDAVTGACMLIKREVMDKVGFFDENFRFGGFEDTDFCLRCRIRGYKIVYTPKSIAFHDERVTSSQIINYHRIFRYNYKIFLKKWSKILEKYNDCSLLALFKLKMYFIYGIFKIIPNRFEFLIKKWLTSFLRVQ
ncbi:MAG: glycosyltransferase family 2 protein [Promethearchaeota archaeon]